MRQWHVSPKVMCRQHLLGEHVEHHMMVGSIKRGKSIVGYVTRGLIDPFTIKDRHDEIVEEMIARGYNHKSPIDENPPITIPLEIDPKIEVLLNQIELGRRCKDCRRQSMGWDDDD